MNPSSQISKVPQYATIAQLAETTDGGLCFIAYHPELPTTISQGETLAEAVAMLGELTEMTVAHLVANHLPLPEPTGIRPPDYQEYVRARIGRIASQQAMVVGAVL